jgi:hypothetical protein
MSPHQQRVFEVYVSALPYTSVLALLSPSLIWLFPSNSHSQALRIYPVQFLLSPDVPKFAHHSMYTPNGQDPVHWVVSLHFVPPSFPQHTEAEALIRWPSIPIPLSNVYNAYHHYMPAQEHTISGTDLRSFPSKNAPRRKLQTRSPLCIIDGIPSAHRPHVSPHPLHLILSFPHHQQLNDYDVSNDIVTHINKTRRKDHAGAE